VLLLACLRNCVLSWSKVHMLAAVYGPRICLNFAPSHMVRGCAAVPVQSAHSHGLTVGMGGSAPYKSCSSLREPRAGHTGVAASRPASDVGRPLLSGVPWRGATGDHPHMQKDGKTPSEDRTATASRGGRLPEDLTVIGAAGLIRQPTQKRAAAAPSADPGADIHWLSGLPRQPQPAAAAPAGEAGVLGDGTAGGLGDLVFK